MVCVCVCVCVYVRVCVCVCVCVILYLAGVSRDEEGGGQYLETWVAVEIGK